MRLTEVDGSGTRMIRWVESPNGIVRPEVPMSLRKPIYEWIFEGRPMDPAFIESAKKQMRRFLNQLGSDPMKRSRVDFQEPAVELAVAIGMEDELYSSSMDYFGNRYKFLNDILGRGMNKGERPGYEQQRDYSTNMTACMKIIQVKDLIDDVKRHTKLGREEAMARGQVKESDRPLGPRTIWWAIEDSFGRGTGGAEGKVSGPAHMEINRIFHDGIDQADPTIVAAMERDMKKFINQLESRQMVDKRVRSYGLDRATMMAVALDRQDELMAAARKYVGGRYHFLNDVKGRGMNDWLKSDDTHDLAREVGDTLGILTDMGNKIERAEEYMASSQEERRKRMAVIGRARNRRTVK